MEVVSVTPADGADIQLVVGLVAGQGQTLAADGLGHPVGDAGAVAVKGGVVVDHAHIRGEQIAHDAVHSQIQGNSGGQDHQHHGGQDADVGQPHGVLLHAVNHPGNGDEVGGLVIISLALLKLLEHGDAARGKKQVGADDHQDDGDEEQGQGVQRPFHRHGQDVARSQGDEPGDGQQLPGPGFPFSGGVAVEELHRFGASDLHRVEEQVQQEDPGKKCGGESHAFKGDGKAHLDVVVDDSQQD